MARTKRKADDGQGYCIKKRCKTEKAELERLKKELEDYVAANEAHRGTERYEAEVAKRKKAYDDFYAKTLRAVAAASRTRTGEAALDAAAKVYAKLETARTASNSTTASGRRAITRLESELAEAQRLLTTVNKKSDTDRAQRRRTEAAEKVRTLTTQLRALERRGATDAAHEDDVAKTRKALEKAERRVAQLRANAESLKVVEELRMRLRAVKLSGKGGPAFRRDLESAETALETIRTRRKSDTTDQQATLRAMVEKFETSTRGGGQLLETVNEAALVVAPPNEKEAVRSEANKDVDQAEAQVADLKRRLSDGDDVVDEVEAAEADLERAKKRKMALEARDARGAVADEFSRELEEWRKSRRGFTAFRHVHADAVRVVAKFRGLGRLDASEQEAAVRAMLDVLQKTSGAGSVAICAQAVADARKAVAPTSTSTREALRSEANKDVDQAETQVADLKRRLSSGDDVVAEVEAAEADLERAKKRKTGLEAWDARGEVADEFSRELEEWRTSKRGFTAFRRVHEDAVRVVAAFRGLRRLDASEQEEAVRAMLDVLKTTSGTGSVAICAQAVADAREAVKPLSNPHRTRNALKYVEETLGQQIASRDWERTFEDVVAQQPKDIERSSAGFRAGAATAALRDRVDALSLTGLSKATKVQKKSLETLINTVGGACSKLERPHSAIITDGKLEALVGEVQTAYDAVQWPKAKSLSGPFRSFKAAAKEARVALEVACALRYAAREQSKKYNEGIKREAEKCKQALDALKRQPRRSEQYTRELEAAQKKYDDAFAKTKEGHRAKFFEALLRAEAGTREVLPDEVYDEGREMADECNAHNDAEIEEGWVVYVGVAGSRNVKAEIAAALKRDSFTVKRKDGRPLLKSQIRVKKWRTSSKVAALLAEKLSQDDTANAHTLKDIAYHLCGAGTLAHTVGDSFLYSVSVKPGPDDDHVPSTYRLGRGVRFSPAFAAELRAATAPLGSMPDHADGDLNVRMRHDNSVKTPTFHVYTRDAWCVFSWKKDEKLRTVYEQRRLWTSAAEARKFAQKKIDDKTAARHRDGPYTVLSTA